MGIKIFLGMSRGRIEVRSISRFRMEGFFSGWNKLFGGVFFVGFINTFGF